MEASNASVKQRQQEKSALQTDLPASRDACDDLTVPSRTACRSIFSATLKGPCHMCANFLA
ncbi:hypothetical protein PC116_g9454 [Phytophthora cactorum]|uniref:Uncharacterized protein n=1 Tax=Phytophthora cactorum TaxID=29920 RepID=A0A8T1E7L4_9STRA|nr:hypothetical protein Pcac1_g7823 [Phytophthora cactorum]KAG2862153.1 hypothetical protein PC113_g6564 [Phytophthora cactorum]KAG2918414.1 hypothetical protein PC114_g6809 [Phytophthora cactorum]KAG2947636.1 hypothetical protein PC117_g6669 [Phytophthora cactorum]KAG2972814.1 hypothetical protein PC118_g15491 [Phytophthora cactorum]